MEKAKSINLAQLNRLLRRGEAVVIDVRSEEEYKEKHIPFAIHMPLGRLESKDATFDPHKSVIAVCGNGGGRSARAAELISVNYKLEAYFLEEGTFGWLRNETVIQEKNKSALARFIEAAHLPGDHEDDKLKKSMLLVASVPFAIAGCGWGVLYFLNDLFLPGLIPFCYGILSFISIGTFLFLKNFSFFRFSQLVLILLLPFFLQLSLGGFVPSSSVILWSVLAPLGALAFYEVRQSIAWFGAFLLVVLLAFIFNDYAALHFNRSITDSFVHGLFAMNILGVASLVYFMQYYFFKKQVELKKELEQKNLQIGENHTAITDSIRYATRIQNTLLANEELLKNNLSDYFILYKPKDIVSGDFYWATAKNDNFYLAVCDSTGHGVPGAFMSLLNSSFLSEAINERNLNSPDEICGYVRQKLIDSISRQGGQDGMDGVLVSLDRHRKMLRFTAAHNAPLLIRKNTLIEFEADKMPVGKGQRMDQFTLQVIDVQEGDLFYLYTDGYADQFGGSKARLTGGQGKKFKYKQLKGLLQSISTQPLAEQKKILDDVIMNWKGSLEQTDDILIIGFRV